MRIDQGFGEDRNETDGEQQDDYKASLDKHNPVKTKFERRLP